MRFNANCLAAATACYAMKLWRLGHALTQGIGLSGFLTYTVFEKLHNVITPLSRTNRDCVRRNYEKAYQTIGRLEIRFHDPHRAYTLGVRRIRMFLWLRYETCWGIAILASPIGTLICRGITLRRFLGH